MCSFSKIYRPIRPLLQHNYLGDLNANSIVLRCIADHVYIACPLYRLDRDVPKVEGGQDVECISHSYDG